jgi:D-alanyl-D-alanine carboxypeptidase
MLSRAPSGRIVLGPRAETTPVPVAFGRTAGSASAPLAANATGRPDSQFARGATPVIAPDKPVAASLFGGGTPGLFSDTRARTASSNGGIPGATTAFAPTGGAAQPSADASRPGLSSSRAPCSRARRRPRACAPVQLPASRPQPARRPSPCSPNPRATARATARQERGGEGQARSRRSQAPARQAAGEDQGRTCAQAQAERRRLSHMP